MSGISSVLSVQSGSGSQFLGRTFFCSYLEFLGIEPNVFSNSTVCFTINISFSSELLILVLKKHDCIVCIFLQAGQEMKNYNFN